MSARVFISAALIVGLGCSTSKQQPTSAEVGTASTERSQPGAGELRSGVFAGPVVGLKYETPTLSGMTKDKGEFQYREGEAVTFLIGNVVLGTVQGAARVNVAQLISRVNGNIGKVSDPDLTNLARLLQTLDQDGNVENGVTIAPQVHTIVGNRFIHFAQGPVTTAMLGGGGGNRPLFPGTDAVRTFSTDPGITGLLADLNKTPGVFSANTPRQLRSTATARNEMRRNIRGILKASDVKIPTRDGSFLYADVFRPADGGKYPPVLYMTVYGKVFERGCVCSARDAEEHEEMEDRYFSGNPDGYIFENHESVNTVEWVPKGYVVVRVITRGICNSPGKAGPFTRQEAEDYFDAIEWAGTQPWSNGNVGLWGMSYTAWNQPSVASLQPPHLKAMIPVATDHEFYEDTVYNGGLFNEGFVSFWWDTFASPVCPGKPKVDFISISKAQPFTDPALHGPNGSVWMSPDMTKVTVPMWVMLPTTHTQHIHQLGSSETYIQSASTEKRLDIVEDWFETSYNSVADHVAFFDYWLKGIKNGIMDGPRVRMWVRTGNGSYYVQPEHEWPIARTKYTKFYLDASPSQWKGDGRRQDFLRLSQTAAPTAELSKGYSAQVDVGSIYPDKPGKTACWATGTSFVTDPVPEDLVLAGYMKLGLWVSSTSKDMDLYASVRVMDDKDQEVNYAGPPWWAEPTYVSPVGWGMLKVSHRKLDPKRSTNYRPVHTHLEADYAPLKANEVVPVEVELWPNTALVKKGHRIRLDLQPHDGCGGSRHSYDASYHTGAQNTIYTGPNHPSYLQLPVIPPAAPVASTATR